MKRIILTALILLGVCVGKAMAIQDPWGTEREAMWRTSITCVAENFVVLATGPVVIRAVQVTSATVVGVGNGTDKVAIHNSTTGIHAGNAGNFLSSSTLTYMWVPSGPIMLPPFVYDAPVSSGAVVNKTGVSCATIFWDYVSTRLGKNNAAFFPHSFGVTP